MIVGGVLLALAVGVWHLLWQGLDEPWATLLPLLVLFGLLVVLLRPAVWRTWLAYLYWVDTWDLLLLLALCLGLGMSAPADLASALETDGK